MEGFVREYVKYKTDNEFDLRKNGCAKDLNTKKFKDTRYQTSLDDAKKIAAALPTMKLKEVEKGNGIPALKKERKLTYTYSDDV